MDPAPLPVPTFETDRLRLAPPSMDDEPAYRRHFVDPAVLRELSDAVPQPYPEHGVRDFLRERVLPRQGRGHWFWGIYRREAPDALIGAVQLWREGKPEHRGFWLGRRFWGRGYMSEAVVPVMDFAFGPAGFERLVFVNAAGNARSRRVKEKTGARLLRREPARFVDPAYTEREVWELTASEWRARRAAAGSR